MSGAGSPSRGRGQRDAGQRGAEVALDVVGQRLERADVEDADATSRVRRGARLVRRSSDQRNAASVLPLPVGAWMSVWRPWLIAAQPSAWACGRRLEGRLEPRPDRALNGASGSAAASGVLPATSGQIRFRGPLHCSSTTTDRDRAANCQPRVRQLNPGMSDVPLSTRPVRTPRSSLRTSTGREAAEVRKAAWP